MIYATGLDLAGPREVGGASAVQAARAAGRAAIAGGFDRRRRRGRWPHDTYSHGWLGLLELVAEAELVMVR